MTKLVLKNKETGLFSETTIEKYLVDNGYEIEVFGQGEHKSLHEFLLNNGYNFKPCIPNPRKKRVIEKGISFHDVINHEFSEIEELDAGVMQLTRILKNGYYQDSDDVDFDEFLFITKDNKIIGCSESSAQRTLDNTECIVNLLENDTGFEFYVSL